MAAEALLSTTKGVKPVTQPKPVTPPPVKPQTPLQTLTSPGIIKAPTAGVQTAPTNNLNAGVAPNPAQTNASPLYQKSVAPTSNPWNDSSGKFNDSYGKGLNDTDYNNAVDYLRRDYTDPDAESKIAQITANYKGLNTTSSSGINANPTSADEAVASQKAKNEEDQSALDQQIQAATLKAQSNTGTAIDTIKGTVGAVGREGIVSAGNQLAASTGINNLKADYNTYSAQLDSQKQQLNEAQAAGNTQLASQLGQSIASTQAVMQSHASDQLALVQNLASTGVLNNATPDQIQQYAAQYGVDPTMLQSVQKTAQAANASDNQKIQAANLSSAVDTFTKLNTAGVPITPDMIASTSQATGVQPAFLQAAAAGYNQTVQTIQADKNLDLQSKQVALNKAKQDLSDQMNGYTTQAAQAGRDLAAAYSRGDMTTVGIIKNAYPSISDPMEQAKLQYQMAQTDDERQKAYTDAINNGLDPGAIMSSSSGAGYKTVINPQTGKYDIQGAEDGTSGGQCGHFVNQVFGSQVMGNLYTQKLSKCDPQVGFGQGQTPPQPGMAFVMPITNQKYGHTGIFLGVDPKNSQNALVKDSNWGENEIIQTHSIPLNQITGYASPPNAIHTSGSVGSLTNQQILQNADAQGTTFKTISEQNQYIASVKNQGFLPGQSKEAIPQDTQSPIKLEGGDISLDNLINNKSSSGTGYLTQTDLTDYSTKDKSAIATAAHANGIKILSNDDATAVKNISEASGDLDQLTNSLSTLSDIPQAGLQAALSANTQDFEKMVQTNPQLSALSTYRDIAPKLSMALSGMKSLRNGALISQAADSMPQPTDTKEVIQQKVTNLKNLLQGNEKEILGTGKAAKSGDNSLTSILGGFFGGNKQSNDSSNQAPVSVGDYNLPTQGGGHIDSTQHIDTNNL